MKFKKWIQLKQLLHHYHYYALLLQTVMSPKQLDPEEKQFEQEVYERVKRVLEQYDQDLHLNRNPLIWLQQQQLLESWFLYDHQYRDHTELGKGNAIPTSVLVNQDEYFETLLVLEQEFQKKKDGSLSKKSSK